MHLVLCNYRSGSSRFSSDLALDTDLEYFGDVFSDQSVHKQSFKNLLISKIMSDTSAMPMAVVKCHPRDVLDLENGEELLHRMIYRSDKVYMFNRRSFDDILKSMNVATCLKEIIDAGYNEEFTITHEFYVPVTMFEKNYFKLMYGNIDLIRVYSRFKHKINLLWYEDIFENHGRLVRDVVITNPTPSTDINLEAVFTKFELRRQPKRKGPFDPFPNFSY